MPRKPVPPVLTVRLTPELKESIKQGAQSQNVSQEQYVRNCISYYQRAVASVQSQTPAPSPTPVSTPSPETPSVAQIGFQLLTQEN